MRIVLTGAWGAPGRHLLDEFMRQEAEVAILRAAGAGEPGDPQPIEGASDVREVPAQDARALAGAIGDADFVVHAHVLDEHGREREAYAAANVEYATALLDACLAARPAGVLHVTGTESYGPGLPPWPVNESWVAHPQGAVQTSLATAEQAVRTYRRRVRLAVLRGAPALSPHGGALRRLARHFAAHPRAGLVGGGRAPLSFAAGPDLARAAWRLIDNFEQAAGHVFHAKSADTSWRELAETACNARGVEPRFWNAPLPAARVLDAIGAADWLLPAPPRFEGYAALTGQPHLIDDGQVRVKFGYTPVLGLRAALLQTLKTDPPSAAPD